MPPFHSRQLTPLTLDRLLRGAKQAVRTHPKGCLHVGTQVQQRAHHLQVTSVGWLVQTFPPIILQSRSVSVEQSTVAKGRVCLQLLVMLLGSGLGCGFI